MAENTRDEQKDQKEYGEPSLVDIEDLGDVSGGGCATGGCFPVIVEQ